MSQQINLFNPVFLKQRKVFTALAMTQALAVMIAGIALLGWYSQRGTAQLQEQVAQLNTQLERREQSLKEASTQLAPRKKSVELEAQVAIMELQLKALREVGSKIRGGEFGNTEGYAGYFRAFARQDVAGLWLTGVSIDGAGRDIGIKGRALDASLVPGYISMLAREQVLKGKAFGSLQIKAPAPAAGTAETAPAPARTPVPYVEFELRAEPAKAEG